MVLYGLKEVIKHEGESSLSKTRTIQNPGIRIPDVLIFLHNSYKFHPKGWETSRIEHTADFSSQTPPDEFDLKFCET